MTNGWGEPKLISDHDEATKARAYLNDKLLEDLSKINRQSRNEELTITIPADGKIIAGLDGNCSYGWLHINLLWVDDQFRGQGFGRMLIERASIWASKQDCHSIWLDTSSRHAMEFYLHLGFDVFGEINNEGLGKPSEHQRWFLKRALL